MKILRLMINTSNNLKETALMSFSSALFEVLLAVALIPRAVYLKKIAGHFRFQSWLAFFTNKRIHNLDAISPPEDIQSRNNKGTSNRNGSIDKNSVWNLHALRNKLNEMNQKDEWTDWILRYRANRFCYLSMSEIQLTIAIPLILFLLHPIRYYYRLQTLSSVDEMIYSISIQLPFEIITQTSILFFENYLYGVEISISKSWKYNMKSYVLLQYTAAILMAAYLAFAPYRLDTKDWPDN